MEEMVLTEEMTPGEGAIVSRPARFPGLNGEKELNPVSGVAG